MMHFTLQGRYSAYTSSIRVNHTADSCRPLQVDEHTHTKGFQALVALNITQGRQRHIVTMFMPKSTSRSESTTKKGCVICKAFLYKTTRYKASAQLWSSCVDLNTRRVIYIGIYIYSTSRIPESRGDNP